MIYVTLGTMFMPFTRLVEAVDAIAAETGEEVVLQYGMCPVDAPNCTCFDFKSHEETLALQREARVIVAHAGIGAAMDALKVGKPFILVPRMQQHGEHMNNHQVEIARAVEERGWGRMITDVEDLKEACASSPSPYETYTPAREGLIRALKGWVDQVGQGGDVEQ